MNRDADKEAQAYAALRKTFENPDPRSYGVFKMIQEIYPALASKIFSRSDLMEKLVMTKYNPLDIMDYPVCGKCETLALWNGTAKKNGKIVRRCTCVGDGCGASTIDPPTFRDWLIYEIKHKAPPDVAETAEFIVDIMALRLLGQATRDYLELLKEVNPQRNEAMGLVDASGNAIQHTASPPKKVNLIKTTKEEVSKIHIDVDLTGVD